MALFLGDIAGMLEIFAIAGGLILLHFAAKEGAKLLRIAGWILLAGGIIVGACTLYYWFTYNSQGGFDTMHPHAMQMMDDDMMREMHEQMMEGGMMDGGMMRGERNGSMSSDYSTRDSIRDAHHAERDSQ